MRFPQSWNVPVAANKRSKFDLSHDVVTTADVFNAKPFLCHEVVPGDKWNIKTETFTRLAPLVVPTFGRMDIVNRFFFVPFRTLIEDWYSFINNETDDFGNEVVLPFTNLNDLVNLFLDYSASGDSEYDVPVNCTCFYKTTYVYERTSASDPIKTPEQILAENDVVFDFYTYEYDEPEDESYISETTVKPFRFTSFGKKIYDLLISLGYQFSWTTETQPSVSTLPFIAFVKVISDFYVPTNFDNPLRSLLLHYRNGDYLSIYDLTDDDMRAIIDSVPYDNDYFTSAWQSPVSPNSSVGDIPITLSDMSASTDVGGPSNAITNENSDGTPLISEDSVPDSYVNGLTKFALNALDALQSYLVRNNLTGYRPIDRLFARYGIKLDYKQTNRALYLGSDSAPVQISDIMATADTFDGSSGAVLGDYAGKGISFNNNSNISFNADEFGVILGISTISPKVGYVQGIDRQLLHLTPFDFFTPEFERLGTQAIMNGELFNDYQAHGFDEFASSDADRPIPITGVFGFTPRYSEYKYAKDKLTGDFRVRSLNDRVMDGYHLFRLFGPSYLTENEHRDDMVFSRNFLFARRKQFDRIFNDDGSISNSDHFMQIFHNEVHVVRNMESLTESLFDEEEKKEHRTVTVKSNGSFSNN